MKIRFALVLLILFASTFASTVQAQPRRPQFGNLSFEIGLAVRAQLEFKNLAAADQGAVQHRNTIGRVGGTQIAAIWHQVAIRVGAAHVAFEQAVVAINHRAGRTGRIAEGSVAVAVTVHTGATCPGRGAADPA